MDLKTIKSYDNSWWLKHLELTTVYDTELIKEQWDWLIEQAEKIKRYEACLDDIINHEEIFGYRPTHTRCVSIAKRTLELYKD
jgi:hypothetical protein